MAASTVTLSKVTVTVPATTANLGPGFDCIGAALTLYNRFQFTALTDAASPLTIKATGAEADRVGTDDRNLAYQAFLKVYQTLDKTPPALHLAIDLQVPLARGLGSSATAIIGGLVGANALAGSPLSCEEVMQMAIEMEGHPDNVVPALIGGCQLAATQQNGGWTICDIDWHEGIIPIVAIPDFELSTAEARRVLPTEYSRQDAIFNTAHLGLLVRALETGRSDWLRTALQDKIHQPYRRSLIHGYSAVEKAVLDAGAEGLVISGAGPTLLVLTKDDRATEVESALKQAWTDAGISVQTKVLQIDHRGATIEG
ncbi:homoserine kinase [Leptolyngbya ohadii]|uniref:homoserine kinase n=1 Tax=Leptolyngbya ohadii TaxID=1962290 RepID=UPI000B59F15C|nr:homoserine kinase [Leptolyngbya ohadii]